MRVLAKQVGNTNVPCVPRCLRVLNEVARLGARERQVVFRLGVSLDDVDDLLFVVGAHVKRTVSGYLATDHFFRHGERRIDYVMGSDNVSLGCRVLHEPMDEYDEHDELRS